MTTINDVQDHVTIKLGALLDGGEGAFVQLVAGETCLAAHKALLAARSPVFAAMFRHNTLEASSGQVNIPDVEGPVLRQLLEYCYTLQAPQLPGMAAQLLTAADKYGLSALKDICEQQLAAQLDVENAAASAVLAVRHSCPELTEAAVSFIKDHLVNVLGTQGWEDVVLNQPQDVVQITRLIAEPPPDISAPATAGGSTDPDSLSGRGQSPDAAAPPVDACHADPPDEPTISNLRSLPQEEKDRRLIRAAQQGAVEELQALLAAGADVGACDLVGKTALHWASRGRHEAAARLLLGRSAEVDARCRSGCTPLHDAAMAGHAAMVQLLVSSSADLNARDNFGWTMLHTAAFCGHTEVVAALINAGANRAATDITGQTPADVARRNNHQHVVELLT